jgi:hypothetical protein
MDARWVVANAGIRKYTFDQGSARARGEIGYPRPSEKFGSLTGAPVIEKLVGYAPIEDIGSEGQEVTWEEARPGRRRAAGAVKEAPTNRRKPKHP